MAPDKNLPLIWCGSEPKENLPQYISDALKEKENNLNLTRDVDKLWDEIDDLQNQLCEEKPNFPKDPHNIQNRCLDIDPLEFKTCLQCLALQRKYPEIYDLSGCTCNLETISKDWTSPPETVIPCVCNRTDDYILR